MDRLANGSTLLSYRGRDLEINLVALLVWRGCLRKVQSRFCDYPVSGSVARGTMLVEPCYCIYYRMLLLLPLREVSADKTPLRTTGWLVS